MSGGAPSRILDLGCGTGHGMRLILEAYPDATVVGVDFSEKMIANASKILSNPRASFVLTDICTYAPQEQFDCVISAITLHNLNDTMRENLCDKLSSLLPIGGLFVNADFYRAEDSHTDSLIHEIYLDHVKRALHGQELDVWLEHIASDNPQKLSTQFSSLQSRGFELPKLSWLFANEAVYSTKRIS